MAPPYFKAMISIQGKTLFISEKSLVFFPAEFNIKLFYTLVGNQGVSENKASLYNHAKAGRFQVKTGEIQGYFMFTPLG